ncbi:MAG: hypothetical protein HC897_09510 [Thermoanaerobaculia bacterium]|nr:hypothetical protein [Thermoanaerobaculia bacterium]
MKFFEKLRASDPSSAVAYHLEGFLEGCENLRALLEGLDTAYGTNPELAAEKLTHLQVEIYAHQIYHLKQLRQPLKRLIKAAYEQIPDIDPDEPADFLERHAEDDPVA